MIVNSFSTFMPVEELAEAGILRLLYNYKDEDNRRNPAQFFSPRKKGDERLFGDLSAAEKGRRATIRRVKRRENNLP